MFELVLIVYSATKDVPIHFNAFRFRFVTFCLNQRVFPRREECRIRCGSILWEDMHSCDVKNQVHGVLIESWLDPCC